MKKLLILAMLMSTNAFAQNEFPQAENEFVKETLEYCISTLADGSKDDGALLACINSELEFYEYQGFASLDKVIEIAETTPDEVPE